MIEASSVGQNAFCAVSDFAKHSGLPSFKEMCGSLLFRVYSDTHIILAETHYLIMKVMNILLPNSIENYVVVNDCMKILLLSVITFDCFPATHAYYNPGYL